MTRSADKARDFRAREAIRQAKDRQRETFDVHASGRALLAHPKMGTSVGGGTVPPAVTVTTPGNVNLGQHVELTATGDSIASGGDYITFGTIADQSGFGGVTAAGASITLPNAAEYTVDLWVGWSSYLLGGTVALELDGVIVHTFDGPTSVGQFFHGSWSVKGAASGVLKVKVTQSSGSAQTCDARVRVTLHDPTFGSTLTPLLVGSASTTSTSLVVPADAKAGDFAVALITSQPMGASAGVSGGAAWTLLDRTAYTGANDGHYCAVKTLEAADVGATWTVNYDTGSSVKGACVVVFRNVAGVDVENTLGASGAQSNSLTLTREPCFVVWAMSGSNGSGFTVSGGSMATEVVAGSGDICAIAVDGLIRSGGATPTYTLTPTVAGFATRATLLAVG